MERKLQTSKLHLKFCSRVAFALTNTLTDQILQHSVLLSLKAFDGKTWNKFIAAAAIKLVQTAVQVIRKAK